LTLFVLLYFAKNMLITVSLLSNKIMNKKKINDD